MCQRILVLCHLLTDLAVSFLNLMKILQNKLCQVLPVCLMDIYIWLHLEIETC
jgi:hypothetical protein